MTQRTFVGRQPIVDRDEHVHGYEILFRSSATSTHAEIDDFGRAAVRVMVNTFASLGVETVLGNSLGFFNVNAEVLHSDAVELLPADRVVIEILEFVEVDEAVIQRCKALRKAGFVLALDDWVEGDAREALLPFVDLVKVDLPLVPAKNLRRVARHLRKYDVELLAEKVETREEFNFCLERGFDYFQGYFFSKPVTLEGADLDPSRLGLIRLLQLISSEADRLAIVDQFKQDAQLGLNLLRLVNSAGMAARVRFESIEDAVRHLGLIHLGRWVAILLYAQGEGGGMSGPLFGTAAHRGRLMELIIQHQSDPDQPQDEKERAFLVGMLSLADALLGCSLDELVSELHLGADLAAALTQREGPLGRLLSLAISVERGDVEKFEPMLENWALDLPAVQELEHSAYAWVHGLIAGPPVGGAS